MNPCKELIEMLKSGLKKKKEKNAWRYPTPSISREFLSESLLTKYEYRKPKQHMTIEEYNDENS